MAVGFVKDHDTARSIVQEAFIGLWEKKDTTDQERGVTGYLSVSVRNRCLTYLRDNRKFSHDLLVLENLSPVEGYMQPQPMVASELEETIAHATAELPVRCREVFELSRNVKADTRMSR